MSTLDIVLADLRAEGDELAAILTNLPAERWSEPTPAEGWTIAHQVAHLAWTDDAAILSASDAAGWQRLLDEGAKDPQGFVDAGAEAGVSVAPQELLDRWQHGRDKLAGLLADVEEGTKLPWFGPPMSPTSMATARLMETWAHGLDVRDTLGIATVASTRLRQVAHLGVRTRGFAFALNGLPAPTEDVFVDLTGPNREHWTWGDPAAVNRVTGPALDFCLLVTQRRNRADLALTSTGPVADKWTSIAQAFAGPPGGGRPPASTGWR